MGSGENRWPANETGTEQRRRISRARCGRHPIRQRNSAIPGPSLAIDRSQAGATGSQEWTNGTPGHSTHDKGATMTMTMTMTMTTREPFICGQPYKPLLL